MIVVGTTMAQKRGFPDQADVLAVVQEDIVTVVAACEEKKRLYTCVSRFPCVCPEPVLGK
jgi:hypothetical protein